MAVLRVETYIEAPQERCFDLARSVDAHLDSMSQTGERAVAGRTQGLMELGEEVTWRARHFGVIQHLTSRITSMERPHRFRDSMVRGAFARFDHDHIFEPQGTGTLMIDVFDYDAPLGPLGWLAERVLLDAYMTRLLAERGQVLQTIAENDMLWPAFVR